MSTIIFFRVMLVRSEDETNVCGVTICTRPGDGGVRECNSKKYDVYVYKLWRDRNDRRRRTRQPGFYYFFFILFIDNDQIVLTCNTCKYQLRIRVVGPVSFTRVVVPNTASGHVESGEFVASPSGSRPAYSIREQIVVIRCSQSCTTHILLV